MWALIKREWFVFFSTPLGYLMIGIFLTLSTLFLWFLDTDFNLLQAGFADLNAFFVLAPWLLLFLVPALSMRSFSEELRMGTLELLLTKPLGLWEIVCGKYIALLLLLLTALLPTTVYLFALRALQLENTAFDGGSAFSAYCGLFVVGASFAALGLLSSLITKNAVSAFLLALLFCFVQFYLWKAVADEMQQQRLYLFFNQLGIFEHYLSLRQGLITLKGGVYFIGLNYMLLYCCTLLLKRIKNT